jgi:hypothetical protein
MDIKHLTKLRWKFPNAQLILGDDNKPYHLEFKMDQDGHWLIVIKEDSQYSKD